MDVKESKWTKKSDARAELLFWSLNLLFFEVVVVVVNDVSNTSLKRLSCYRIGGFQCNANEN